GCKAARCRVLSRARSLRLRTLPASLHHLLFARDRATIATALGASDRLDEPARNPRRSKRARVDAAVRRPAVGHQLVVAQDRVLVAEPRAADVAHARVDAEAVVEAGGHAVAHVRFENE